ncbi:siphovirus Gp157 family protein [Sellimonas caecigallum]|uniref:Siphovirus Gp157 family protein n=1 Tax=Sellimonas caecigallum TaxID=2592333 RepID=A0ABS7L6J6_9FIRM|nr:siphovirus Gp157 family protein [Sellimonas caecigallum]MBY0758553.1 siphovirus Gp157 family protein [Sellimonas caecigallum]
MGTLYEITGQLIQLKEMAMEEAMDQKMISDTMEGIEFEFEEKADGYAKVIAELNGDIDVIDKEIDRLIRKKNLIKNNISSIKKNLENSMVLTGKKKFKTALFNFGIQKNPPSVVIDHKEDIPEQYLIPQDPKLDKTAIKNFLKENEVSWAHLTQTESLRIR